MKPLTPKGSRKDEVTFSEIVRLIATSREKALRAVNTSLIELYWQVGEIISRKVETAEWGEGVVDRLADFIAKTEPGLRGFTRRNLFRMKQFYEAYCGDGKVSPLVAQLPWSHHLIILGQSKRAEEREFYVQQAFREQWSKRELERQFKTALFERAVLHPPKVTPVVAQKYPEALSVFRDAYAVEFLGLPASHVEADLHRALLENLKKLPYRTRSRLLLRRIRVSPPGRRPGFCARSTVLSPRSQLPGCH